MATIASNQLAIYAVDSGLTSPMTVIDTADIAGSVPTTSEVTSAGIADNEKFLLVTSGQFEGIYSSDGSAVAEVSFASTHLLAAATTTTMDTSNTINEVSARNGSGSSTNYIASGAFAWNFSIDGLIDLSSGSGSPVTVLDLSRDSKYVVVKFVTDVNNGTNNVEYAGQALIESASMTGGVDDIATYSATFRGYGELYKLA
jgi:hypothetical protein